MESLKRLENLWDRVGAVAFCFAGGVALIFGWVGVSGQGLTSLQIPYVVSGGLGGIFLMGLGAALWLSADLRDEWAKLDRIERVLEDGLDRLGLGRTEHGRPLLAPLETIDYRPAELGLERGSDTTVETPPVKARVAARTSTMRVEESAAKPRGSRSATKKRTDGLA
jgi:hypothetical protein